MIQQRGRAASDAAATAQHTLQYELGHLSDHFTRSVIGGLVRRDVRHFGAGRESGFVYHRAKASLMPLAVLPWITYLALPISVHPLVILLSARRCWG